MSSSLNGEKSSFEIMSLFYKVLLFVGKVLGGERVIEKGEKNKFCDAARIGPLRSSLIREKKRSQKTVKHLFSRFCFLK